MLFSLPLYVVRVSFGPLPTTVVEVLFFIVLIAWFVANRSRLSVVFSNVVTVIRRYPVLSIIIGLILLSATIGIFIAPDKLSALGVWRAYFVEPLVFFLLCLSVIDTAGKIRRAWWLLLLSGLCIAVFAIVQKFTGFAIPETWLAELRVTSIYPYPNAVGLYLAPLVAMALPFARYYCTRDLIKEKLKGIAVLCVAMIMLIAIFFAQTEAALVALGVVVLGFGLLGAGKRIRYASMLIGFFIALTVWLSPVAQQVLYPKLLLHDWSGFVRRTTWSESVTMLQDHWITGVGLSGYQTAMAPYHKATYIEIFMFPHNILLNVWTEMGILGVAGVLLLLVWCAYGAVRIFMIIKNKYTIDAQWHGCVLVVSTVVGLTMLIHGLVDVPYFKNDLAILSWFFFAIFFITYVRVQKDFSHRSNALQ